MSAPSLRPGRLRPYDPSHYDLTIPGWMEQDELHWLYNTATRMRSVVEIGCYQGRSTYALLKGCKGPVYAIDPWGGLMPGEGDMLPVFRKNLEGRCTIGDLMRLYCYKERSEHAIDMIPGCPDMVFIDGDHLYPGVVRDIEIWLPKATKIICGHDFGNSDWPDVERAVCERFGDRVENPAGLIWSVRL